MNTSWMESKENSDQSIRSISITDESEDEDWNDPDLLNNHQKLMKLKFTEEDLQLASSSSQLYESAEFIAELILNDPRLSEMLQKHSEVPEEACAIQTMEKVNQNIFDEQKKCMEIIVDFKNKYPFWVKKTKEELFSDAQKAKVNGWVENVKQFAKICERAQALRKNRKSILVQPDPERVEIVKDLENIYKELSRYSKIFDNDLLLN